MGHFWDRVFILSILDQNFLKISAKIDKKTRSKKSSKSLTNSIFHIRNTLKPLLDHFWIGFFLSILAHFCQLNPLHPPPQIFVSIFRFSTLELVEIDPNAAADPTQARSRALVFFQIGNMEARFPLIRGR